MSFLCLRQQLTTHIRSIRLLQRPLSTTKRIKIVEVGPRDGLQNEPILIKTEVKVKLIQDLVETGLKYIEAASFVSPKWVPQMGDGSQVMQRLGRFPQVHYLALTPNLQGFEAAQRAKVDQVAVFASASEGFSKRNINASIADSLKRFEPVMEAAKKAGIPVRGYVSCALGCPIDGKVEAKQVAQVAGDLYDLGCEEVSVADTIGVGTPGSMKSMIEAVQHRIPIEKIAVHCHDTYGQALANIYAALQEGVTVVDSSVGGLGGCPYAPGATGNVATEDVVYLCEGLGYETGIDLPKLAKVGNFITELLGKRNASRVANALTAKLLLHQGK